VKAWINNYCCVQTFPLLNPTKQSPDFGAKFRRSLIENALAASVYLNATHLSEKLIYNGVGDVNTYFGRPLYVAVGKGLVDIARQILDKEVPTPEVRRNAIWSAAMNGQIPAIQLLLEPKYAANIDDACEWNTFELAARQAAQAGQRDTVLFLVQQASLRGLLDSWRGTVMRKSFPVRPLVAALYDSILWHAALGGQEDMVRLALDNGANIHAIRQPGMGCSTPLDAAARSGHEGVVRLLIARGASPIRQRKTLVQRPLVNAVEGGWLRIAQILIEHGAEVNPDKECLDRVPLMAAVKHRNAGAVRLLLQNGAGLEGCRAVSKEAYSYAALHGFAKIMHILEEYGVDPTSTA
jgi:ankyrin repeat protein